MIPEKAQFDELPGYWRRKIRQYRQEAAGYRIKCRDLQAQIDVLTQALAAASEEPTNP